MSTRTQGITIICVLAVFQSLFRFIFTGIALTGAELIQVEISQGEQLIIGVMFIITGAGGLLTTIWLWQMQRWGFWGTILLSLVTIVFDVWALTIQFTAAMGLVLPVIFTGYLFSVRDQFA